MFPPGGGMPGGDAGGAPPGPQTNPMEMAAILGAMKRPAAKGKKKTTKKRRK